MPPLTSTGYHASIYFITEVLTRTWPYRCEWGEEAKETGESPDVRAIFLMPTGKEMMMDADDYCDMMLPEDDENDMTRIDKIKALCEGLDADRASTQLKSVFALSEQAPKLLELVEEMAGALEDYADGHYCRALAKYKAWNEGGVMETTQTFSGYDQSKVDELVRDAIDRAKGYYAYTHTSWLSNGGYEVTVQFKKKD